MSENNNFRFAFYLALAFVCSVPFARQSFAGNVDTLSGAAYDGSYGVRISTGSQCQGDSVVTVSGQTYSSSQSIEGCERVQISNSDVTNGAHLAATGGYEVQLSSGFGVDLGSTLAVATDPVLVRGGFVANSSPNSEPHYAVRFYLNADNLSLPSTGSVALFSGVSNEGDTWFQLRGKYDSSVGENKLFLNASEDSGALATTEGSGEVTLPIGWNFVELEWRASEVGQSNGMLELRLNDTPQPFITGIDNESARIDLARWGLLDVSDSVTGSIDLDEFDSRRAGVIGPAP